jgi:dTMP kinase
LSLPDGVRGRLIVLEGPDGAGKSEQARILAERLRRQGRAVTEAREPGGTRVGEQVRAVLLDPGPVPRGPVTDALLFTAARAQLVREVLRPALARGDVVVCDRYATSTIAYQGYGSGLELEVLATIQRWATDGLEPDLVVLIDVPPEVGLERLAQGRERDRFEDVTRHDLAFHDRVRAGYLEMAADDPDRWRVVDGTLSSDAVAAAIARMVEASLARS